MFDTDALKKGHSIRLIGDNINWNVSVHDERIGRKNQMQNAFGSAIIVQNFNFSNLCETSPQSKREKIAIEQFLVSHEEMDCLMYSFAMTMANSAVRNLPYFNQFSGCLSSSNNTGTDHVKDINTVIPLPVLLKNEQKYAEVVDILDYYENVMEEVHNIAEIPLEKVKIHTGGDQLTRERFSGAKCLRGHHKNDKSAFKHLSPITFEFFHMNMNFIQVLFDELYSSTSAGEIGTLKFLQERLSRSCVNSDVKKAYDADKDFIIAVTDIYKALAIMNHFGMNVYTDGPIKNQPTDDDMASEDNKRKWIYNEMKSILNNLNLFNVQFDEVDVLGGLH